MKSRTRTVPPRGGARCSCAFHADPCRRLPAGAWTHALCCTVVVVVVVVFSPFLSYFVPFSPIVPTPLCLLPAFLSCSCSQHGLSALQNWRRIHSPGWNHFSAQERRGFRTLGGSSPSISSVAPATASAPALGSPAVPVPVQLPSASTAPASTEQQQQQQHRGGGGGGGFYKKWKGAESPDSCLAPFGDPLAPVSLQFRCAAPRYGFVVRLPAAVAPVPEVGQISPEALLQVLNRWNRHPAPTVT